MVALTLIGGEGSDLDLVAVRCWELGCVGIEELDDTIRATFADRATAVAASTRLAEFVIGAPLTIDDPLAGWSPDLSVFHRADAPPGALLGHHWFQRPYPFRGILVGCRPHGYIFVVIGINRLKWTDLKSWIKFKKLYIT